MHLLDLTLHSVKIFFHKISINIMKRKQFEYSAHKLFDVSRRLIASFLSRLSKPIFSSYRERLNNRFHIIDTLSES